MRTPIGEQEVTLRIILLTLMMYRDGKRYEHNFDKMLDDIIYDVTQPKMLVSRDWLVSHGFID